MTNNYIKINRSILLILTNAKSKAGDEPHFEFHLPTNTWTFHNTANYTRHIYYPYITTFFFRAKTWTPNNKSIYFIDDAATSHDGVSEYNGALMKYLGGVHQQVAKCATMYLQAADSHCCNGRLKIQCVIRAREWRSKKLKEFEQRTKANDGKLVNRQVIGEFTFEDQMKIVGQLQNDMNTKHKQAITRGFRTKFHPDFYDEDIRDLLNEAKNYQKKYGTEHIHKLLNELTKKQKESYAKNIAKYGKNQTKFNEIQMKYAIPSAVYQCPCGWVYHSKYGKNKKKRIREHEVWCPVKSYYGIVPGLQPQNPNDPNEWTKDFKGWIKRRGKCKSLINIKNRQIHWDEEKYETNTDFDRFLQQRTSLTCGKMEILTAKELQLQKLSKEEKEKESNDLIQAEETCKNKIEKIRDMLEEQPNVIMIPNIIRTGMIQKDLGFGYIKIVQITPPYDLLDVESETNNNVWCEKIVRLRNLRYKSQTNVWIA